MIEIIDPKEIAQEVNIINSLSDFGLNHLTKESNLGWNYILDHVWLTKQISDKLDKTNKELTILDVGCGKSIFHNYLEERFRIKILGVDRPYGYCNQKDLLNVDFLVDFLEFNQLENNSVDIVYWCSSIEHNEFDVIKKLFKKSIELLSQNGLFLATFALSKKTKWFPESQQTNLSIEDASSIFEDSDIRGNFNEIKRSYSRNTLLLRDKYKNRYGHFKLNDPTFITAGISKNIA